MDTINRFEVHTLPEDVFPVCDKVLAAREKRLERLAFCMGGMTLEEFEALHPFIELGTE